MTINLYTKKSNGRYAVAEPATVRAATIYPLHGYFGQVTSGHIHPQLEKVGIRSNTQHYTQKRVQHVQSALILLAIAHTGSSFVTP
jgi:hypothetical protein